MSCVSSFGFVCVSIIIVPSGLRFWLLAMATLEVDAGVIAVVDFWGVSELEDLAALKGVRMCSGARRCTGVTVVADCWVAAWVEAVALDGWAFSDPGCCTGVTAMFGCWVASGVRYLAVKVDSASRWYAGMAAVVGCRVASGVGSLAGEERVDSGLPWLAGVTVVGCWVEDRSALGVVLDDSVEAGPE